VVLTNYRLVFLGRGGEEKADDVGTHTRAMNLEDIESVQDCANWYSSSTRLEVVFTQHRGTVFLKFTASDKTAFMEEMVVMLGRRAWTHKALNFKQADAVAAMAGFDTRKAGVAGLQRRREKEREQVSAVVTTATAAGDLDALMHRARDVVAIVQRYAAYEEETRDADSAGNGGKQNDNDKDEMVHTLHLVPRSS